MTTQTLTGRVLASFGKHLLVEDEQGVIYRSIAKGKKNQAAVGDWVRLAVANHQEAVIETVVNRQNLLYRSDDMKSKQFAANVDQLLIVVATEPEFNPQLISRALTGAWSIGLETKIILNKTDIKDKLTSALSALQDFKLLNIPILEVSTLEPKALLALLHPHLEQKTSLLLGQSGMGKSSILNVLIPSAQALTQEISLALGTGKHTTTHTRLYKTPNQANTFVIDSPGFQAFGLKHLSREELERGFPEFEKHTKNCKFYNCSHRHEPGCGVLNALDNGLITNTRHQLYTQLLEEHETTHY